MKGRVKGIVQFIVLLSIGIAFIWFSLRSITADEKAAVINAFKSADYSWVGLGMLISVISHLLRAYRWNYLLEPTGNRVNPINSACHVFIGYLANYGIPRMGEVTRCSLAAKYDKVPFQVGFGTVITERIVDLIIFVLVFFLTLAVQFGKLSTLANTYIFHPLREKLAASGSGTWIALGIIVAILVVLFALRKKLTGMLKGRIGSVVRGVMDGLSSVARLRHPWRFVFLSFVIWACYFYSLYACLFAVEGTSSLGHAECLTLLLFGTIGVMFSPGGLGAYPAIVGGILTTTYQVDTVSAFAVPWLSWGSQFVVIVVLGIASFIVLPLYNRKKDEVSPVA